MLPEETWIARIGASVAIQVQLQKHSNKDWQLDGRVVSLEVPLTASIGQLKTTLAGLTKCPANKQKIHVDKLGFLKDANSLAHYNVRSGMTFVVEVKERGRKKK